MKTQFKLTEGICKVSENGDFSFTPAARPFVFLLLIAIALLILGVVVKQVWTSTGILFLAMLLAGLMMWASQPKTFISPTSGVIVWDRWFRQVRYPFNLVSCVNVFLDRHEYAWSTHLVDRRKNIVEMNARLEIILEHRRLCIGTISGDNAEERALSIAQSVAKTIGVPVSHTGYKSRYL